MDAVEYLKESNRMCGTCICADCPSPVRDARYYYTCLDFSLEHPEEAVRIVEEWSKNHPVMTNSMKFEEVFGKPVAADGAGNRCAPFVNVCIHRECSACNEWWDEPYKEPKHVPEPYDGIPSDDLFPDIPVEKKKFTEG